MRRWITALIVLGMAGAGVVAAAPAAVAANPSCLVVDTPSDQSYSSLQAAVDAAAAGDTLFVKGTCTGATTISTDDLTITGQSNGGAKTATLDAAGADVVLAIPPGVSVTLNTLIMTNASNTGILDDGLSLTLNGSTVTGSAIGAPPGPRSQGGGIGIFGYAVTLNNSSVTGNIGFFGGGIENRGTLTLNGSSTVTGNTGFDGGGIYNDGGTLTLNDSSTVTGNTASDDGGGIYNSCGTLNGAVPGTAGNVFGNTPDDIISAC